MNTALYHQLLRQCVQYHASLIAVSKTKPVEAIRVLYDAGQRDFGENRVQELLEKAPQLPGDIRWHLIGHLQTNKVKAALPYVCMIHSVDSRKLLDEIDRQSAKLDQCTDVLLQIHLSGEETKFGLDAAELRAILQEYQTGQWPHVRVCGLMGMSSLTDDMALRRKEFRHLHELFLQAKQEYFRDRAEFHHCSMGMSDDYPIALEEGASMIRVGSLLFGQRNAG
jgi:pyridoxal phosphate enzyme (YggS family)